MSLTEAEQETMNHQDRVNRAAYERSGVELEGLNLVVDDAAIGSHPTRAQIKEMCTTAMASVQGDVERGGGRGGSGAVAPPARSGGSIVRKKRCILLIRRHDQENQGRRFRKRGVP